MSEQSGVSLWTKSGEIDADQSVLLTHGGVGANPDDDEGTRRAARLGIAQIAQGASAMDAVVAAMIVLEDDPAYNAGTGAAFRRDGTTMQMDASIIHAAAPPSEDEPPLGPPMFGAVAGLEGVQNPIRVAQRVAVSPQRLIIGRGAIDLAREMGLPTDYDASTELARQHWRDAMDELEQRQPVAAARPSDTVGAILRLPSGETCGALSTGGVSGAPIGRVGDVPIFGAGVFVGNGCAVAVTGHGEWFVERLAARAIHERLNWGHDPERIIHDVLRSAPEYIAVGVLAIGQGRWAVGANRGMPWGQAG